MKTLWSPESSIAIHSLLEVSDDGSSGADLRRVDLGRLVRK